MKAGGTNLAADRSPFIGREQELAAVGGSLDAGVQLLTVVGQAGMGKTRLARRLARERVESFSGGCWFCDLTEARTEADLVAVVAGVLGVPLGKGRADGALQLADAIAARGPILLVLDNFENLAPHAVAPVERLLERAPEARLLVTSLVRLGVEGEAAFELSPLALPDAIALFEERARRAAGGLQVPPAERGVIEELVLRLDRIPLAIELAAARMKALRPRQLLGRIDERFELLQGSRHGRHTSLLGALRCSWDLLAPWEREALAQCSVFAGGFTLEAAEAILDPGPGAPSIHEALEGLRDKALLQLDDAERPRFTLYESVREFAERELERQGSLEAARERHGRFYVSLGEALATSGFPGLQQMAEERENLLAVHRRFLATQPALATRAVLALNLLLSLRGPPASELGLLESSVEAARRTGDGVLLARTLRSRAATTVRHGRVEEARTDVDEAIALALAAGDRALASQCWTESGRVRINVGDLDGAREDLERAIAIQRELGEHLLEGMSRNILGMVDEGQGRLEASVASFEEALKIFRRCGNTRLEGIALLNLGVVQDRLSRLEDARSLLEQALGIFRRIGDRASEADTIVDLGSVALTAGRLDEAEGHFLQALARERELGNRRFEGLALGNLGIVALERGQLRLARQYLQETLAIFRECGERRFLGVFQMFFAAVEAALGLETEARADFAAARAWLEELQDPGNLATLAVLEGFLALAGARSLPADEAEKRIAAARARLEDPARERSSELVVARRILRRAVDGWTVSPKAAPVEATTDEALAVGPEASWFAPPRSEKVDLRRRGPLRRVLQALVDQRLLAPGVGLTAEQLFAAGWPGERALPAAASGRVYTAVRTLRSHGLEPILLRHDDGYLLDPQLPLQRART